MVEFNIDLPQLISLLIGTVLPLLVGLVTTRVTSSSAKSLLLAGLALVTSILTEFLAALNEAVAFDLGASLIAALGTFLVSVGIHYGLWKPTGTSATLQDVGAKNKGNHLTH